MSRAPVVVREARPEDAPALVELWSDELRGADAEQQRADMLTVLERASADEDEQVLVAEHDGRVAGAILLRVADVSPLNLDRVVQAFAPHVAPDCRRRGVGRTLMDAAVVHAEERGIGFVGSASMHTSRDANRFFARLGLGPLAVLRIAPTPKARQKLVEHLPRGRRAAGSRPLGQVLAARRSMRRHGY